MSVMTLLDLLIERRPENDCNDAIKFDERETVIVRSLIRVPGQIMAPICGAYTAEPEDMKLPVKVTAPPATDGADNVLALDKKAPVTVTAPGVSVPAYITAPDAIKAPVKAAPALTVGTLRIAPLLMKAPVSVTAPGAIVGTDKVAPLDRNAPVSVTAPGVTV
jgi:hypothetical protein